MRLLAALPDHDNKQDQLTTSRTTTVQLLCVIDIADYKPTVLKAVRFQINEDFFVQALH